MSNHTAESLKGILRDLRSGASLLRDVDIMYIARAADELETNHHRTETLNKAVEVVSDTLEATLDKLNQVRKEKDQLRRMMIDAGMCPDCGEIPVMDEEGPFSHCGCGTQEDYGTRSAQAMQLKSRLCPTCRQSDEPLAIYYICDGCERAWKEVENGHTDNIYAEPNDVKTTREDTREDAIQALDYLLDVVEQYYLSPNTEVAGSYEERFKVWVRLAREKYITVKRALDNNGASTVNEWQQPDWRPINTYPKDQGVYQNGTRAWLWHETLGVVWGYMDAQPSGFRCELYQQRNGEWVRVAYGVKAARQLVYWMPKAPEIPESPRSTS